MTNNENHYPQIEDSWARVHAQFAAGNMLSALTMLRSLASKGALMAYVEIGNIYELGGKGVPRDDQEALRWYHRAICHGDDPMAHLGVGRILYNYKDAERNDERALYHLREAGNHPVALMLLGLMFQFGRGTTASLGIARQMYKQLMDAGYVMPMVLLGRIEEAERDYCKGLFLRLRAGFKAARIGFRNPKDPRLTGVDIPKAGS